MPVVYVPIDVDNPARDKIQKRQMAEMMNEGWVATGILYLKDGMGTTVKVEVLRKDD